MLKAETMIFFQDLNTYLGQEHNRSGQCIMFLRCVNTLTPPSLTFGEQTSDEERSTHSITSQMLIILYTPALLSSSLHFSDPSHGAKHPGRNICSAKWKNQTHNVQTVNGHSTLTK